MDVKCILFSFNVAKILPTGVLFFHFCSIYPGFFKIFRLRFCVFPYVYDARARVFPVCEWSHANGKGALSTRSTFCRSRTEERPSCRAFCSGAFIKSELPVGKLRTSSRGRPALSSILLDFRFVTEPLREGATGYNRESMTGRTNCIHTRVMSALLNSAICSVRGGLFAQRFRAPGFGLDPQAMWTWHPTSSKLIFFICDYATLVPVCTVFDFVCTSKDCKLWRVKKSSAPHLEISQFF